MVSYSYSLVCRSSKAAKQKAFEVIVQILLSTVEFHDFCFFHIEFDFNSYTCAPNMKTASYKAIVIVLELLLT
jgi:hypothetical protein